MLNAARKETGLKSRAALMRMSIERGLPLVVESLTKHRHAIQN